MILAASLSARPAPTTPLPLDAPLASFAFTDATGATTKQVAYPGITGYESPETAFVPAATYEEAISYAEGFATDHEGYPAQAVLQAADGAFYITALNDAAGTKGRSINIDGDDYVSSGFTGFTVARHSAALQAIVGGEQTIDLRNAPIVTTQGWPVVVDKHGKVIGVQG